MITHKKKKTELKIEPPVSVFKQLSQYKEQNKSRDYSSEKTNTNDEKPTKKENAKENYAIHNNFSTFRKPYNQNRSLHKSTISLFVQKQNYRKLVLDLFLEEIAIQQVKNFDSRKKRRRIFSFFNLFLLNCPLIIQEIIEEIKIDL